MQHGHRAWRALRFPNPPSSIWSNVRQRFREVTEREKAAFARCCTTYIRKFAFPSNS